MIEVRTRLLQQLHHEDTPHQAFELVIFDQGILHE